MTACQSATSTACHSIKVFNRETATEEIDREHNWKKILFKEKERLQYLHDDRLGALHIAALEVAQVIQFHLVRVEGVRTEELAGLLFIFQLLMTLLVTFEEGDGFGVDQAGLRLGELRSLEVADEIGRGEDRIR